MSKAMWQALLVLVVLATCMGGSPAQAQTLQATPGLSVSPAILELGVVPDQAVTTPLRVTNPGSAAVVMRVGARAFEAGEQIDEAHRPVFDASEWMSLSPSDFLLAAGETKEVVLTVRAPLDAPPGGRYASVVLEPLVLEDQAAASSNTVTIAGRITVPTLLTVAGPTTEELVIEEGIGATGLAFDSRPSFELVLRNEGNIHTLAFGTFVLERFGRPSAQVEMPPTLVLPYTSRRVRVTVADGVGAGVYTVAGAATYGSPERQLPTSSSPFLVASLTKLSIIVVVSLLAMATLYAWRLRRQP